MCVLKFIAGGEISTLVLKGRCVESILPLENCGDCTFPSGVTAALCREIISPCAERRLLLICTDDDDDDAVS